MMKKKFRGKWSTLAWGRGGAEGANHLLPYSSETAWIIQMKFYMVDANRVKMVQFHLQVNIGRRDFYTSVFFIFLFLV